MDKDDPNDTTIEQQRNAETGMSRPRQSTFPPVDALKRGVAHHYLFRIQQSSGETVMIGGDRKSADLVVTIVAKLVQRPSVKLLVDVSEEHRAPVNRQKFTHPAHDQMEDCVKIGRLG
jgi:hypothetical protein